MLFAFSLLNKYLRHKYCQFLWFLMHRGNTFYFFSISQVVPLNKETRSFVTNEFKILLLKIGQAFCGHCSMCQITCSEWSYPEERIYHKLMLANVKRFRLELYFSVKQNAEVSKHESQAKKLTVCDRETLMNGISSNWYLVQNDGKDSSFPSTSLLML